MPSPNHTRRIETLTRQLGIARGETAVAMAYAKRLEQTILAMNQVAQAGVSEIRQFDDVRRTMQMPRANTLNSSEV